MVERQVMEADIVCVGFGPAMGGFLTTLTKGLVNEDGSHVMESPTMPGMPLSVICYERADDTGYGVSGVVSKARAIRASLPELSAAQVPLCAPIRHEKLVYLLDPVGASRRPKMLKLKDKIIRSLGLAPARLQGHGRGVAAYPGFHGKARRAHLFHRPVQPVGGRGGHGQGPGPDLAGHARGRARSSNSAR